ncbi:MAG: amylo-alpha-1,6-glucosidase [Acidothermaceae bacterium]
MARDHQPYLHDLVSCVRAPVLALSPADGQIRPGGAAGIYHSDRRIVDELQVRVDGAEPVPVANGIRAAHVAWFTGVVRALGDPIADPTVTVERQRELLADGLHETITLRNHSTSTVAATIALRCGGDLAAMQVVKAGHETSRLGADKTPTGLNWADDETEVVLVADPPPSAHEPDGVLRWEIDVATGSTWQVDVTISCKQSRSVLFPAPSQVEQATLTVQAGDHRLARLVDRGIADIAGLFLADPDVPTDVFVGAGSPWFLTLFGRDSLWTARLLLPTGTDLAASTLRVLARRQGTVVDPDRDEEPGKILHEVRRADLGDALPFAPVYYGTVDATPLWICLLCEAWRWGMPADDVAKLIPHLERALVWMRDYGDADGDGFLEYQPSTEHGLSNQGWKDSHDSVQWLDGELAAAPVALCEVQGYAYAAACSAAELLAAFGRPGADEWRAWANRLSTRFREAFWVELAGERYPAIALDKDKRRVDTVSSNIGHLLGTGILDAEETALVATRLGQPDMDSGWGLRTMTSSSPRFNPLSYHGGSVWPHDTAITMLGLAATGHHDVATSLAAGLVGAAEHFDFRLPELFGGHDARQAAGPIPYPAACRPQAWAAACGVAVVQALLGLQPDVPSGRLRMSPLRNQPFGALDVDGLVVAGSRLRVRHDPAATPPLTVDGLPAGVTLES